MITRDSSIAIMCDDFDATVEELRAKGAQFRGPIEEREYGRTRRDTPRLPRFG